MKERIYIETMGCQMNVADSERAATRLKSVGYELAESAGSADAVIFNTCSVRERAEQKVFSRIGEVLKERHERAPLIGIMGCVAQLEGGSLFTRSPKIDFIIGTGGVDRITSILDRAFSGKRKVLDVKDISKEELLNIDPQVRHSPHIAFLPIIEGCNKFCTYCIVPYSRGRERSKVPVEIIDQVNVIRSEGFREIHLIGQNVNSYRPKNESGLEKFSGGTPFSRLLRAVAATGIERIKFTTSFPRDFHPDIIKAIEDNENLCNWVHLPVQSGSNRILRAMRRGYNVEDYLRRVDVMKSSKRNISLTSDIIVGFPGETEEDFEETVRLIETCQYDSLYIFKYSKRPGTPSFNLVDSVSRDEKTDRFLILDRLQKNIQHSIFQSYIGRELKVLVEGRSAKSAKDLTGHSTCHKVVNFPGAEHLIGSEVKIRVKESKVNSLYGELS